MPPSCRPKIHTAKVETSVVMTVGGADRHFTGVGEFDFDRQVGAIVLRTPQSKTPLDEIITPGDAVLAAGRVEGRVALGRRDSVAGRGPDQRRLHQSGVRFRAACAEWAATRRTVAPCTTRGRTRITARRSRTTTGTLDLTTSAQQSKDPIKGELLAAAHSFSQSTVPFDAYLDGQNKLRRLVAHFTFPAEAPQRGEVQIAATTDLFDLDQPVTVVTHRRRKTSK